MSRSGSYAGAFDGEVSGRGRRFAVVVARFNGDITSTMRDRVEETFLEHGVRSEDVLVLEVPGAWELPQAAREVALLGEHDAIVAVGCVIRGETSHFDFIAGEAARGLGTITEDTGIPVVFGVLTTETREQALERADPEGRDKGRETALSALWMASLFASLRDMFE